MERPSSFQGLLERLSAKIAHFRLVQNTRTVRERQRILIVEDQLFSRKLLHQLLHEEYEVDLADSAQEGLLLYLQNAPDIVFLDIELKDESGHILARAIRMIDPKACIIMVTANNSVEDVSMAKSNKVAGFIVKPYSKQKIADSIKTALETQQTTIKQGGKT